MLQKQTQKQVKVNLYHVTCINKDQFQTVLNQALEYIWTHMHCSVIKLSLYHFQNPETGNLQINSDHKNLLKSKGFKWKTVINDVSTGQRVEVMECPNFHHKDQIAADKCVIYRKGLTREDVHKEPFTMQVKSLMTIGNETTNGSQYGEVQSMCLLLNSLIQYKRDTYTDQNILMSEI